jgi:5-methylcytosine-specific restriction endonuclease McrA
MGAAAFLLAWKAMEIFDYSPDTIARRFIRRFAMGLREQSKKHLPRLVAKQDGLCVYCREPIYLARNRPGHRVVSIDPPYVHFKRHGDETVHIGLLATVEHTKPLSMGGDNSDINLVAACFPCNNSRARQPKQEPESEFPATPCQWCGTMKLNKGRLCDKCKIGKKSIHLHTVRSNRKRVSKYGSKRRYL